MAYVVYTADVLVLGLLYASKTVVYDKNDFNLTGHGTNGNRCYLHHAYSRI